MLTCREATRLISASMDGELPLGRRIGLRLHLFVCRFCTRYERQLLRIRNAVRRIVAAEEGPAALSGGSLSVKARERIRNSLRNP